jgi:hypothetical protein
MDFLVPGYPGKDKVLIDAYIYVCLYNSLTYIPMADN